MTFEKGTRIRVRMDATVVGTVDRGQNGATQVRETYPGDRWTHFIYLGSKSVTGEKTGGGTIRAEFDAKVTGNYKGGTFITTEVTETNGGYIHYLYLDSPLVTVITDEPAAAAATPAAARKEKTVSPDRSDKTITSRQVADRIGELEENTGTGYDVVRKRNGEVLESFSDAEDARQYIEDEDYNPERVIVREQEADEDDLAELAGLRELDANAGEAFGRAWRNREVTLYNQNYFDSSWARQQAENVLGSDTDTYAWPLNLIDWSAAAEARRDERYTSVTFDDTGFYAEND